MRYILPLVSLLNKINRDNIWALILVDIIYIGVYHYYRIGCFWSAAKKQDSHSAQKNAGYLKEKVAARMEIYIYAGNSRKFSVSSLVNIPNKYCSEQY